MKTHRIVLTTWALLVLLVLASGRVAERVGDSLQVALPVAAWGCAIAGGNGLQYFGRYILLEAGIKIPKLTLGDAPINQRPNGGSQGFPSGHTAAATFGATGLAVTCLNQSKLAQGTVLMAAAFTGTSRADADKHTAWQVLAGAVWGWFVQVAALSWFDKRFRRFATWVWQGLRRLPALTGQRGVPLSLAAMIALFFPADARAEVDVQVYTGWQTAPHSNVSGNDPLGTGAFDFTAGWDGDSFAAPPHYGIRAIWWRNDLWGYDVDFNHTKVYADAETLGAGGTSGGFEVLEFTDGLNALTFGVVRRWPDQWGDITPYAGFSVGVALPHVEVKTTSAAPETSGYQLGGPAAAWRVGGYMPLSETQGLFAEYKGT